MRLFIFYVERGIKSQVEIRKDQEKEIVLNYSLFRDSKDYSQR